MKITRFGNGDAGVTEITGNSYQCKHERINTLTMFTFNGKVPSRRLLRVTMKEIDKVGE